MVLLVEPLVKLQAALIPLRTDRENRLFKHHPIHTSCCRIAKQMLHLKVKVAPIRRFIAVVQDLKLLFKNSVGHPGCMIKKVSDPVEIIAIEPIA